MFFSTINKFIEVSKGSLVIKKRKKRKKNLYKLIRGLVRDEVTTVAKGKVIMHSKLNFYMRYGNMK